MCFQLSSYNSDLFRVIFFRLRIPSVWAGSSPPEEVQKRVRSLGAMECLVFLDGLSRLHEGMDEELTLFGAMAFGGGWGFEKCKVWDGLRYGNFDK